MYLEANLISFSCFGVNEISSWRGWRFSSSSFLAVFSLILHWLGSVSLLLAWGHTWILQRLHKASISSRMAHQCMPLWEGLLCLPAQPQEQGSDRDSRRAGQGHISIDIQQDFCFPLRSDVFSKHSFIYFFFLSSLDAVIAAVLFERNIVNQIMIFCRSPCSRR